MNPIKIGNIVLPNKPLSNFELLDAIKQLKIPNFKGVFLRDQLPKKTRKNECGIINLADSDDLKGTHWTCWYKKDKMKIYFDSYGVQPPLEIIDYLKNPIYYPIKQIQDFNQVICGHLCLYVLNELNKGKHLYQILDLKNDDDS